MSAIEPTRGVAVVMQPAQGQSFWQPVPANGHADPNSDAYAHADANARSISHAFAYQHTFTHVRSDNRRQPLCGRNSVSFGHDLLRLG